VQADRYLAGYPKDLTEWLDYQVRPRRHCDVGLFYRDAIAHLNQFAAYLAIWIILALYLFSIHSREKKLRDVIRRLKEMMSSR
jgi:hypothetical protein